MTACPLVDMFHMTLPCRQVHICIQSSLPGALVYVSGMASCSYVWYCRGSLLKISSKAKEHTHGQTGLYTQDSGEETSKSLVCRDIYSLSENCYRMHGKGCYEDPEQVKWEGKFYNGKFYNDRTYINLR